MLAQIEVGLNIIIAQCSSLKISEIGVVWTCCHQSNSLLFTSLPTLSHPRLRLLLISIFHLFLYIYFYCCLIFSRILNTSKIFPSIALSCSCRCWLFHQPFALNAIRLTSFAATARARTRSMRGRSSNLLQITTNNHYNNNNNCKQRQPSSNRLRRQLPNSRCFVIIIFAFFLLHLPLMFGNSYPSKKQSVFIYCFSSSFLHCSMLQLHVDVDTICTPGLP